MICTCVRIEFVRECNSLYVTVMNIKASVDFNEPALSYFHRFRIFRERQKTIMSFN